MALNRLLCPIITFVQGGGEVFDQVLLDAGAAVSHHCLLPLGSIVLFIAVGTLALLSVSQQLAASVRPVKIQQI